MSGQAPVGDRSNPGLVIADAARFIPRMPMGTTLVDARQSGEAWLFNNLALSLRSPSELATQVSLPHDGSYRLFVRSSGDGSSGFRVKVGEQESAQSFGVQKGFAWTAGGVFELKRGATELRISAVQGRPSFDVVVLTKEEQINDSDVKGLQFHSDVSLLKEYSIPRASSIKFGDFTRDGKLDFAVLTSNYSAHAFDHEGKELWKWEAPPENSRLRGEFEAPGSVWDFDRDGYAELVHWRWIDNKEWLVMADGRTGAIKHQTEWPTPPMPHVYNNFRTAVARLRPGTARDLVVFTDSGGRITITAYDDKLRQLWQHVEEKKKDHLGHYIYPVDVNRDGIDEVVVSHLCLDAKGKVLWNRFDVFSDHHDHSDDMKFGDIDGDGTLEIAAGVSDAGLVISRATSGEIVWQHMAEHTQQVEIGRFLDDVPGQQIVVNGRIYGVRGESRLSAVVSFFDSRGNLLKKWPRSPVNGNPDFVQGDWSGTGQKALFWHRFRFDGQGEGALYFGEPVYHMLDFVGNGAEQVVAHSGTTLRIYGSSQVKPKKALRDSEYLRSVANHSHY